MNKPLKIDQSAFKMKQKLKNNKAAADKNAVKKEEEIQLDREVVLSQYDFSNIQVDHETMDFLKEKTLQVKAIVNKSFDALGKLFSETQEELAKHGYGCFETWYTELGFRKQTVYNYINRHNLIVQQLDKRELIESLPLKLVYAIANPNCPTELKDMTLKGEIKNFNELVEYKNVYKEEKQKVEEMVIEYDEVLPGVVEELDKLNADIKRFYTTIKPENKPKLLKLIEKFEKEVGKILE